EAARGGRPQPGQPAGAADRRRADRQSRLDQRGRGAGAAARAAPRGRDHTGARHARSGDRRPCGPHGAHQGRDDRRRIRRARAGAAVTVATLALRNLLRRPTRTTLLVLGIALAVATAVALLALSRSIDRSLNDSVRERGADLTVSQRGASDLFGGFVDAN